MDIFQISYFALIILVSVCWKRFSIEKKNDDKFQIKVSLKYVKSLSFPNCLVFSIPPAAAVTPER